MYRASATSYEAPAIPDEASATPDEASATPDEAPATPDEASATLDEASATPDEASATSDEAFATIYGASIPFAYSYTFFILMARLKAMDSEIGAETPAKFGMAQVMDVSNRRGYSANPLPKQSRIVWLIAPIKKKIILLF